MATAISKYAFINAKLRARISQILPDEIFSQLAKAATIDAALAILRDTPFVSLEEIYSSTGDIKLAELDLLKYEVQLYKDIRKSLDEKTKQVVTCLLQGFEIDNLKNAIRIYFSSKLQNKFDEYASHYLLYNPIVYNLPIDLIINAGNLDEIAGLCEKTPYAAIIRKYIPAVEAESSLFRLEIGLDQFYYKNLLDAVEKLDPDDRAIASRLIGLEIDLQNISWILRFKEYYDLSMQEIFSIIIPGGSRINRAFVDELYRSTNATAMLQGLAKDRYQGLTSLLTSETGDNIARLKLIQRFLEQIREYEVRNILAGYPFSIGIILGYFMLKNNELRKLRIILNAKQYGSSQQRIEGLI